jgi:hypothetical protein
MNTIEKYRIENENEHGGWRRVVGAGLAGVGLLVFANATLVALLFRQALSLQTEIMLVAVGGVIGVVGLRIRGYKSELIIPAILTVVGGLGATLLVNIVTGQFGFLGLLLFGATMAWSVNKLFSRVDD